MNIDIILRTKILFITTLTIYALVLILVIVGLSSNWYEIYKENWSSVHGFYFITINLDMFKTTIQEGAPYYDRFERTYANALKEENVEDRQKYEELMYAISASVFVCIPVWVTVFVSSLVAFLRKKDEHARRSMVVCSFLMILITGVASFRFVTIPGYFKKDLSFDCNYAYWCDRFKGDIGPWYWTPKTGFNALVASFVLSVIGTLLCFFGYFTLRALSRNMKISNDKNGTTMTTVVQPVAHIPVHPIPVQTIPVQPTYLPPNQLNPAQPGLPLGPPPPGYKLVQQQIPVVGENGQVIQYVTQNVYQPI